MYLHPTIFSSHVCVATVTQIWWLTNSIHCSKKQRAAIFPSDIPVDKILKVTPHSRHKCSTRHVTLSLTAPNCPIFRR